MTWQLLAEIALKSLALSALALLLLRLLRHRSPAERSWVAHAALAAILLLPAVVLAGPRWQIEAPAPVAAMLPAGASAQAAPPAPLAADAAVPAAGPRLAAAPGAWLAPGALPLIAWAVPAALLLLVTLLAILRLHALRARAQVLVEQEWLTALARAQRRMGFKHGTALLVSGELSSPVSWGILRPIILLNEQAVAARGQAEAIIAHELAHVARLDWLKLLVARAAVALFWFNPLVWLLARQCHQLREEAADDAVLSSDVAGADYAALLVGAARHESRGMLLAANGVAPGPGSLKRRVARVLDAGSARGPARAGWASACAAGALLVAAPLAALVPVGAAPPAPPRPAILAHGPAAPAPAHAPALPHAPARPEAAPAPAALPAPPRPATAPGDLAPPLAAAAGTVLDLPAFSSLSVQGGGDVLIRHGRSHSVRLLAGDARTANISVDRGGALSVVSCGGCRIEIVAPNVDAVAMQGGGRVTAEGAFPARASLALAIQGGGRLDLRALRSAAVMAAVSGGGEIFAHAERELLASVNGGGTIAYAGNPEVNSSVSGGGSVIRAR